MGNDYSSEYVAFVDTKKVAEGDVVRVITKLKKCLLRNSKAQILVFDCQTSEQVDFDFRGNLESVIQRLKKMQSFSADDLQKRSGPGRPKLGVIAKEVTLLPEHWEWLGQQPGGASVTLRKLVEEAKKKNYHKDQLRKNQESVYKFMTVMAGDRPHYEEALRALYADDPKKFKNIIEEWPKDIREHLLALVEKIWK